MANAIGNNIPRTTPPPVERTHREAKRNGSIALSQGRQQNAAPVATKLF